MKNVNWNTVAVIGIIVLLVLLVSGGLFGGRGYGGWGMMGPGMTLAPGASAGVGGWGFSPFGWFGMLFMWLIPVGFLVLTVLGIAWVVRAIGGGTNSPSHLCPSCGRNVQADWRNCPYCGTVLAK
jgi:hypothetical protein